MEPNKLLTLFDCLRWEVRELEQFLFALKLYSNEWEGKNEKQKQKRKKKKGKEKAIGMGITNSLFVQFDFIYVVF